MKEKRVKIKAGNFRLFRVPDIQAPSEKVPNMVGTFLNEDIDGLKIITLSTTQTELKKVTNMEGTFLKEDSDGFRIIKVTAK